MPRHGSTCRTREFTWYDGEKLPFPDETFHTVIAICVLHHVPISRRFKLVSEMVRVARADGVVAIFEHNPLNPLTRHAVNSCELDHDAVLLRSREALELLKEAAESEPQLCHYLFSPLGGPVGRALDRGLQRLPLGGQYAAWVQRPHDRAPIEALSISYPRPVRQSNKESPTSDPRATDTSATPSIGSATSCFLGPSASTSQVTSGCCSDCAAVILMTRCSEPGWPKNQSATTSSPSESARPASTCARPSSDARAVAQAKCFSALITRGPRLAKFASC